MSEEKRGEPSQVDIRSYYVRERHGMAVFGQFAPIYMDYYLHLMQNSLRYEQRHDQLLKDALATVTLHLCSRPQNEMTAWTINLQDPVLNLFVTGDSEVGNVCGRVFTQDVKTGAKNLFFAQMTRPGLPVRQSTVEVAGSNLLEMVEQYYDQSEQLPARLFRLPDEAFAMIVAQPDCDLEWFQSLDGSGVERLADTEELRLLETRRYHFGCGCTLQLIYSVLAPVARGKVDELYQGEDSLKVQCPRCGSVFSAAREGLERYLAENPQ